MQEGSGKVSWVCFKIIVSLGILIVIESSWWYSGWVQYPHISRYFAYLGHSRNLPRSWQEILQTTGFRLPERRWRGWREMSRNCSLASCAPVTSWCCLEACAKAACPQKLGCLIRQKYPRTRRGGREVTQWPLYCWSERPGGSAMTSNT